MTLEGFRRDRRERWEELESLLDAARGRPERLGPRGLLRLGALYRGAAADLAVARRSFPQDPVRTRLEGLVRRGGLAVYEGRTERRSVLAFFARDYWVEVAARPLMLAVSAALLLGPALLAAAWAANDPGAAAEFIPEQFEAATDPPGDAGTSAAREAVFSTELFTHNIQVTFLAFALGITAGLGTAVLLAFNGVLLGAIAGAAIEAGNGGAFLEFAIPHGPLELSCIVVTAAAGLRLGWALVDPGHQPRGVALAGEGRRAIAVVLGTMPWLVVAGIVEAFVRSSGLSRGVLLAVGLGLFGAYWTLVLARGRPRRERGARRAAPAPQSRARALALR